MKTVIIIPARYGSTRFPGKPLVTIAGKTMLQRVCDVAQQACCTLTDTNIIIATDDDRIMEHAQVIGVQAMMTPIDCKTGSDRVWHVVQALDEQPDIIVNLQGDAPLTPPRFIQQIVQALAEDDAFDVATPVVKLTWGALDNLREAKQVTPFSGTTAIVDDQNRACWFSKNIIPAMRHEARLRAADPYSPVYKHVGLYAYRYRALKAFINLPQTPYEKLEELEQLRFLENGYAIRAVPVSHGDYPVMSGVDSPEDAVRAEKLVLQFGEVPA